jgi:ankyrin repeat/BTB/POZ domain-containing protein 1
MAIAKHEIEQALHSEHQQISSGRLREDNPLDNSPEFQQLCQACRRGDLRVVLELIQQGVNVNGRDIFDYTPLILVCNLLTTRK